MSYPVFRQKTQSRASTPSKTADAKLDDVSKHRVTLAPGDFPIVHSDPAPQLGTRTRDPQPKAS